MFWDFLRHWLNFFLNRKCDRESLQGSLKNGYLSGWSSSKIGRSCIAILLFGGWSVLGVLKDCVWTGDSYIIDISKYLSSCIWSIGYIWQWSKYSAIWNSIIQLALFSSCFVQLPETFLVVAVTIGSKTSLSHWNLIGYGFAHSIVN